MEMSHQAGAEAESLLRPEQRGVVVPRGTVWEAEGEKAPFIRNEPVKLTPAWEGSNLPNDTLNLKGISMAAPPDDRGNLIYLTMILHGIGTLTAWNMFITAKDYFVQYKLKDSFYSDSYLVYVGYASQLPNFFFSWFNVFVKLGGNLTTRIVWSLMFEVVIFVITIVLAMLDSSEWKAAFFFITIFCVFVLNACNAVFQNSVFGVAARLPQQYIGAVVLGTNVCGTLVVLLNWFSNSVSSNLRTSAIYYFIGGMFVLLLCFDTYFALPLNKFYRYHETMQQRTRVTSSEPAAPFSYVELLKKIWMQLYNVFMIFFVSLAVFPAVHSDIYSTTNPNHEFGAGFLGEDFARITCFLTFNFTALIGNITANIWKIPSKRWLVVFTTVRLVFIPLFLLCNYHPKNQTRTLGVLFDNDYMYWMFAILLGWSSGHGSSLAMMYVGSDLPPEQAGKAGMLGGAMLVSGIFTGIAFSGLEPGIVTSSIWKKA